MQHGHVDPVMSMLYRRSGRVYTSMRLLSFPRFAAGRSASTLSDLRHVACFIATFQFVTLYAFSTENWNRPESEVSFLMNVGVISQERRHSSELKDY